MFVRGASKRPRNAVQSSLPVASRWNVSSAWRRTVLCGVCLVWVSVGCGAPVAGLDDRSGGASDASGVSDSGEIAADSGFDAGDPVDAGEARDAGEAVDAGETFDAGEEPIDAGPRPFPWAPAPNPPATEWFENGAPACSRTDWLAKYFAYRHRLYGDGTAANPGFVNEGLSNGQSMVPGLRNPRWNCNDHWLMTGCTNVAPSTANGMYLWGDGTVWMGWYMQALATEYEAFRLLGLDTSHTARAIAFALSAINRLDENAEVVFGRAPARDGFFLRDDVAPDFIFTDPSRTQFRFPRADGFEGYGCIASGGSCGVQTTADGDFMSQDQVIEMLPGLALIAKFVPDDLDVALARGTFMRPGHEAKQITARIVGYLKANDWIIRDPNGETPPNQWGGSARPYSHPIALSAERILAGTGVGLADYEDGWTAINQATWLAADTSWPLQTLNNQAMILALGTTSGLWTMEKLVTRSTDWSAPTFPMIKMSLDGRAGLPPGVSAAQVESMLTSAPCGGPCHNAPDCEEAEGWMGEHRFKSPEDRNGDVYGYDGEYAGIDYMLLHNLYVIAKGGRGELAWEPPPRCRSLQKLTVWLEDGAALGDTFDPWEPCDTRDFEREFCGRSFASWLDGAYAGTSNVFVAGKRLECEGRNACVLVSGGRTGTGVSDLYLGTTGDDAFDATDGDDCLYGFGGADVLSGDRGADELHGGEGNDELCGESCLFTDVGGENDVLFGGPGDDSLCGGPGIDSIYCGEGDDLAKGDQAEDTLFGGPGDDDLDGEMGGDIVNGGDGNDRLLGGLGDDKLHGGAGRDKLDGQDGDDFIDGGDGDDILFGDAGKDALWAGNGADRLCGGCGEDFLHAGWDGDVDQCRARAANTFTCFQSMDGSPTVEQCQDGTASDSECRDTAWENW